jgi:hypothetical protein
MMKSKLSHHFNKLIIGLIMLIGLTLGACTTTPPALAPTSPSPFGQRPVTYDEALALAIKQTNPDLCDFITVGLHQDYVAPLEELIDTCKSEFAIKTRDLDYCLSLQQRPATEVDTRSQRDICLEGLARELKRLDLCDLLHVGETYKHTCKIRAAYEPGQCETLCQDTPCKDTCYTSLAENLGDPEVCNKINDDLFRDGCYRSLAVKLNNSANKLGVHLLLSDGRYDWPTDLWPDHMQYARQAVGEGGFVVELVRLDDLDLARWQIFMDLCAELYLTPILRLATIHDDQLGGWTTPPQDPEGTYLTVAAQYAQFVAALRWPTEAHYVIVGNEPNHGPEWGGRPNPAAYARFLIDVADALHAADPQARVLNAGFDSYAPNTGDMPFIDGAFYMDEETFLDQMIAAQPDVFTRLDAWASHAYPLGPFTEGPWQQRYQVDRLNNVASQSIEPPPGIYNRGVNSYKWELFKLSTYGLPPLPVLITETGWHHAASANLADDPASHRALPKAETVADYLDLALRGNAGHYPDLPEAGWTPWLDDPRVIGVVFFALDGHPSSWDHTNLLALDQQGRVLDTYAPFDLLAKISARLQR